MAVISNQFNEDKNKKSETQEEGSLLTGKNDTGAINPMSNSQGTQGTQGTQGQPQPVGSGHFTNIQSFLGANKNAGQQLGQTLQKGIGQQLGMAQNTAGRQLGEANTSLGNTQNLYNTQYGNYQNIGGTNKIDNITAPVAQPVAYKDATGNTINPDLPMEQIRNPGIVRQQDPDEIKKQDELIRARKAAGIDPFASLGKDYTTDIGSRMDAANKIAKRLSEVPISSTDQKYSFDKPTGNNSPTGTMAKDYTTDIGSRMGASSDIANDKAKLDALRGMATGTTQNEQSAANKALLDTAQQGAASYQDKFNTRQKELGTETGRSGLLSEFVGGKNYGIGQRSLDSAFLQRDPNRAVDQLKQNVNSQAGAVQKGLENVGTANTLSTNLNTAGTDLGKQLGAQTSKNVQDYTDNLQSRIKTMEAQRGEKLGWANKEIEDFKNGKPLSPEFLKLMNVQKGSQLWNVPKSLNGSSDIMDVSNLSKSLGMGDVTNEKDVANMNALYSLAGTQDSDRSVNKANTDKDISQYADSDSRTMTNRQKEAYKNFINQTISGSASVYGQGSERNQSMGNLLGVDANGRMTGDDDYDNGNSGGGFSTARSSDAGKDMGYAQRRAQSALMNAQHAAMVNGGYFNYMGDEGMNTAGTNALIGSWDGGTFYDPTKDLKMFGYGDKPPTNGTVSTGGEAIVPTTGTGSRNAALAGIAATGDTTGQHGYYQGGGNTVAGAESARVASVNNMNRIMAQERAAALAIQQQIMTAASGAPTNIYSVIDRLQGRIV